MKLTWKDRLLMRLENYPLLRQMVCEVWFRITFSILVLGGVGMILFLPKWWKITPDGFMPEVSISGLDLVQAWSLRRGALEAEAAGKEDDAIYCWSAAWMNNVMDLDTLRSSLRYLATRDLPKAKYYQSAFSQARWLLSVDPTNKLNIEVATQMFEKYRAHEMAISTLRPFLAELTPVEEATYLKALFRTAQMDQFAARWEAKGKQLSHDPELPLYYAAYEAGWGTAEQAPIGRAKLAEAKNNPKMKLLAHQLQLMASWQLGDPETYAASLQQLYEMRADTILENANYWRLLAQKDRKEEGRKLAMDYPYAPSLSYEALEMAAACLQLDLTDYAAKVLKKYAPQFSYAADLWASFGDLLIKQKKWEELRDLALQIRREDGPRNTLIGYSYYIEGRVEQATGREEHAKELFARAGEYPFDNAPNIGMRVGAALKSLGYSQAAHDVLWSMRAPLKLSVPYWNTLFEVANDLKSPALLLHAATRAFELQPNDATARNNYAAALLINRTHPEEAVKITFELLARYPDAAWAKINHGIALVHNGRLNEARAVFDSIEVSNFTDVEATAYHFGRFEVAMEDKRTDDAWRAFDKIERRLLFPNQVLWLDAKKKELPTRTASTR